MRNVGSRFAGFAPRSLLVLSAILVLALLFVPSAGAQLGVVGEFEFGANTSGPDDEPGQFQGLRGIGVNFDGSGSADPGDLFAQDEGGSNTTGGSASGSRISQFSASGEFRRAWGLDVVESGPGNAEETQSVQVKASGGTFELVFEGESTGPLAYDAGFGTIEAALQALDTIGGEGGTVSVTGGPGDSSGSNPYLVTFGGSLGGTDQPLMVADASGLGGGSAPVVTTSPGGVGFEICEPSQEDECKAGLSLNEAASDGGPRNFVAGALGVPTSVAVDQEDGSVYSIGYRRVTKFTASGAFERAFGYDVVRSGPHDSTVSEQQQVRIVATSGTFTLTGNFSPEGSGNQTTAPIPYNAPASAVKQAIDDLIDEKVKSLQGIGAAVTVTGGPGGPGSPNPYVLTFDGILAGDDFPQFTASATDLVGTPKSATVTTLVDGGAPEICLADDLCKPGPGETFRGAAVSSNGILAVAPESASNAGNVLVADQGNRRVTAFTADGEFVRTFGWDVVASGPGESTAHEQQQVTVSANSTGGKFSLLFNGATTGATGVGTIANGSSTVTGVSTTNGAFAVGQVITVTGSPTTGLTGGRTITAVGAGTLTLSAPATASGSRTFAADSIDYNASAAQVEAALNALPTIGGVGGSVSVSVSGAPAPANPYRVTFGGTLGGDDVAQMTSSAAGLAGSGTKTVPVTTPVIGGAFEICPAGSICQRAPESGTSLGQFGGGLNAVAEDSTGAIYTLEGGGGPRVQKFTPSGADLTPSFFGPVGQFGNSATTTALTLAVGPSDEVFAAKLFLGEPGACLSGAASPPEQRLLRLSSDGSSLIESSLPCAGVGAIVATVPEDLEVDPGTGAGFLARPLSGAGEGSVFVFGEAGTPPDLTIGSPSNVTPTSATISGTVTPNGPGAVPYPNPSYTRYRVEFRKVGAVPWTSFSPNTSVGGGSSPVPFSVAVTGLEPKTEYEARVVVSKPRGFADIVQTTSTFTTLAAPPAIDLTWSSNVTASSANLHALINPRGTDTTFHFEYGLTPAYGSSTPEVEIGDSLAPVPALSEIAGLEPRVYHFRVVATNSEGSVASTNQTFTFYPEPCPNATVRQQTGSSALPDCRAYELVSPGKAGTVLLHPGGDNSPTAGNPSRLAFFGEISPIPGPWNPPSTVGEPDQYVAGRTTGGWQTEFIGFDADVLSAFNSGTRQTEAFSANAAMDRFLVFPGGHLFSAGPYMWDAQGQNVGRLPTNVEGIPGAQIPPQQGGSDGDWEPSDDLSHYFFSSRNVAFTPDGLISGAGSAYDNDVGTGDVSVVSKLPSGADIPPSPGAANVGRHLLIPGASQDGSHVLIAAPANCAAKPLVLGFDSSSCPLPLSRLYMRVPDAGVTYAVSADQEVDYRGMTADGSVVYFTSSSDLTGDDGDTSIDLYQWTEVTDSIQRVSQGTGLSGDTDACSATWIAACGVEVVPERGGEGDGSAGTGATTELPSPRTDNAIAADRGDVYFYSPEQLVGGEGIPGRRNLYVARDGGLHYVATLDADKPATRIQVSPDGGHAALLTRSRLTTYDNAGFAQMYAYDFGGGGMRCVSCHPRGLPPASHVLASQAGIFMVDDGRTFFSTDDALVPADTNHATDVYEYADGRPQLITSGAEPGDQFRPTGLVGVSADGVDVYFTTLAALVPADQNGRYLKFYDARTGGGFPVTAQLAPCEAADECHGADTRAHDAPRVGTTSSLGEGGNVPADRCGVLERRAKRLLNKARSLRRDAVRLAGSSNPNAAERARRLRRRAQDIARRGRKVGAEARTCRVGRRAGK